MKKLLITTLALSTIFFAGCGTITKTSTSTIDTTTIPETAEHGHDAKGGNVDVNDSSNIDGIMSHETITSEEQFIAEMIPHHQEAIDTSKIIVAKGDAEIKKIAEAIVEGQSKEVIMLKSWLSSRYPNSTYKTTYQNMMRPLTALSGHELEDSYMEDMVKHHEGAIEMAKQVLEISQKPEIVKFANDVINTQSSEVTEFKKLLEGKERH